ncbi:MAG: T9SS type A sorting domain-containing protein, partial [Flavobacteriales bacterium]
SCVTLEDSELGTVEVLSEGLTWIVTLEEGEISDRFILHVGAPATISADAVSCFGSEDGSASITSADGMFNLQWFNEMDELIASTENFSGTSTLEGVAFGNYTAVLTSDDSACSSLQETVYVDTPAEHELNSTHGIAYCNEEGSAYLAINFNAPEVTLNVSSNGNEVINSAYTGDVLIEELNAAVYTIDATSACNTWSFEIDLTDENALSIEVPTPALTPVIDGQGVIVLEANIAGFGNVEWFNNGTSVGTGNVLEYSITQAGEYNFTAQVTNDTCSDQVDVVAMAESAVGIIENTSEASLVFNGNALGLAIPNETGNAQIDVFSSNGQLVESFNLNAQASVQWLLVNDLATGVYTVQVIMNNKKLLSETFVK